MATYPYISRQEFQPDLTIPQFGIGIDEGVRAGVAIPLGSLGGQWVNIASVLVVGKATIVFTVLPSEPNAFRIDSRLGHRPLVPLRELTG